MSFEPFTAVVQRGFISRMVPSPSFERLLQRLPDGAVAQDADAVPHYVLVEGQYREYYGFEASSPELSIYEAID